MTRKVIRDTKATPITLPTYACFSGMYGLLLFSTPQYRVQQSPVFDFAQEIVALWVWGVIYTGLSLGLGFFLWRDSRLPVMVCLAVMMLALLGLGAIFIAAAVMGDAAPTTALWPVTLGVLVAASIRSLNRIET